MLEMVLLRLPSPNGALYSVLVGKGNFVGSSQTGPMIGGRVCLASLDSLAGHASLDR